MSKRRWLNWTIITLCLIYILSSCEITVTKEVDTPQQASLEVQVVTGQSAISRGEEMRENYLDIPLTEEMQTWTKNQSNYIGIPYALTLAVMDVESGFNPDSISETNDYGIMQINKGNQPELERIFADVPDMDLLDIKDNIICGTYLLGLAVKQADGDFNKALMIYNMGEETAKHYWNKGVYATDYSRKVLDKYETYRTRTEGS